MQAGRAATGAEAFIAGLSADVRQVSLNPADRAMLDYVDTLTRTPVITVRL